MWQTGTTFSIHKWEQSKLVEPRLPWCSCWLSENDQSGLSHTAKCSVAFLMHTDAGFDLTLRLSSGSSSAEPKKYWQLDDVEISCEETTSWRTASGYLWAGVLRCKNPYRTTDQSVRWHFLRAISNTSDRWHPPAYRVNTNWIVEIRRKNICCINSLIQK